LIQVALSLLSISGTLYYMMMACSGRDML